ILAYRIAEDVFGVGLTYRNLRRDDVTVLVDDGHFRGCLLGRYRRATQGSPTVLLVEGPPRLVSEVYVGHHAIGEERLKLPLEVVQRIILILDHVIRDLLARLRT